jgi:hypothetical protein
MSTFCHIWCALCGGVLDTAEEDGTRRSQLEIVGFEHDEMTDRDDVHSPDMRHSETST